MKDLSKENQGSFQETLKINTLLEINKVLSKEREDLIRENKHLRDELEKLKGINPIDRHELKANPQKQLSIEKVLEKKLDEIITVLDVKTEGKRRLYADIISNVEKILIKLALLQVLRMRN